MIWSSKYAPLVLFHPFCDGNMAMAQECSSFIPTNFKDDNNEYDGPYPESNNFWNHVKEFSVGLNGCMKRRYYCWLFFFLTAAEI